MPIAGQIIALIRADGLPPGAHLPAQQLADRLGVSRSPVNKAFEQLEAQGAIARQANRGYFVTAGVDAADGIHAARSSQEHDPAEAAYLGMAEDRLRGELPDRFAESLVKARYGLTLAQTRAVLTRIAQEGWIEKKPGYGWAFSSMLTTPDSLLQSYRLRLAVEPAALLEPGYRLSSESLAACRAAEHHLVNGGIGSDTPDRIHARGVCFHESLVEASGNPFFIETVRRVNRVRRLLSYRSMQDRQRYVEHCRQHLEILDLIEAGDMSAASNALRDHLGSTLRNMARIAPLLA